MEIQKNLHLIKITDLQNLSRTKGRGGGAVKKINEFENKLEVVEN